MADEAKSKKAAAAKPAAGEKKPAAPKKEKEKDKAAKPEKAEAPKKEKEKAPPRPPADPRMKYLKKLRGRFLPKGELRERHQAILRRWSSGEDHGGVTVEEVRGLYEAWKASRAQPAAKA